MKQLRLLAATVLLSVPMSVLAKSAAQAHQQSSKDLSQQSLLVELTGKDISKENDITLYAEMVSAYQSDDEIAFKSRLQSLLARFPQSAYADNALFLAGRMAVDHNNYAEAIKYFARLEKEYPRSNKLGAAKFAKAMTYKKMNLPEFAKRNLQEVRVKFPGSPESFRADAELKMFK
ncbi:tetratricopeptide repeat protein [Bdellovibrio sp. HCB-162]|uniref:tetratricopeptide repeat protein n=1 Tax=Bdellovibrio sp. HCB-162 TaxID=3394234 RepID=UPI0039BD29AB